MRGCHLSHCPAVMSEKWTADQIPSQTARVGIVTGSNRGLGLIGARELARAGARVVMACRNTVKGEAAAQEIRASIPAADVEVVALDLASQDSVRAFADGFRASGRGLDLLINNAGVMAPPRTQTLDGHELQMGTNHLGHFALTCQLLGAMEGRADARVVTVSSNGHKFGRIKFDDLQSERHYFRWRAYGSSDARSAGRRT